MLNYILEFIFVAAAGIVTLLVFATALFYLVFRDKR